MKDPIREIEIALGIEAAAHAAAAAELNPFGEAEAIELGDARAVYSGQWSPVHGVFALGIEEPVTEHDLREVEKFFFRKERAPAFWVAPATDSSLLEFLRGEYQPVRRQAVHGWSIQGAGPTLSSPEGVSNPDHGEWATNLTRMLDPAAKEAGLFALTKLHQRETRFYLGAGGASYTFFSRGIALSPIAAPSALLALQFQEAKEFQARMFVTASASSLPFLYERILYERI